MGIFGGGMNNFDVEDARVGIKPTKLIERGIKKGGHKQFGAEGAKRRRQKMFFTKVYSTHSQSKWPVPNLLVFNITIVKLETLRLSPTKNDKIKYKQL